MKRTGTSGNRFGGSLKEAAQQQQKKNTRRARRGTRPQCALIKMVLIKPYPCVPPRRWTAKVLGLGWKGVVGSRATM